VIVLLSIGVLFSVLGLVGTVFLPKDSLQKKRVFQIYGLLIVVTTLFYSMQESSDVGKEGMVIIGLMMSTVVAGPVVLSVVLTLLLLNRVRR
jgi:hypothetical protein